MSDLEGNNNQDILRDGGRAVNVMGKFREIDAALKGDVTPEAAAKMAQDLSRINRQINREIPPDAGPDAKKRIEDLLALVDLMGEAVGKSAPDKRTLN